MTKPTKAQIDWAKGPRAVPHFEDWELGVLAYCSRQAARARLPRNQEAVLERRRLVGALLQSLAPTFRAEPKSSRTITELIHLLYIRNIETSAATVRRDLIALGH